MVAASLFAFAGLVSQARVRLAYTSIIHVSSWATYIPCVGIPSNFMPTSAAIESSVLTSRQVLAWHAARHKASIWGIGEMGVRNGALEGDSEPMFWGNSHGDLDGAFRYGLAGLEFGDLDIALDVGAKCPKDEAGLKAKETETMTDDSHAVTDRCRIGNVEKIEPYPANGENFVVRHRIGVRFIDQRRKGLSQMP